MNAGSNYHSSVGGPNNFFKGKMAGKVVKKGDVEYRQKMATNILSEQIDAMPEEKLNLDQKDYVKSFITMPPKMKEIVIETMLEYQRRGNFVRMYPTKNSDYYDCFLSSNRQTQQQLYYALYSDCVPSFKDLSKSSNFLNYEHLASQLILKDRQVNGRSAATHAKTSSTATGRLDSLMKNKMARQTTTNSDGED